MQHVRVIVMVTVSVSSGGGLLVVCGYHPHGAL